MRSAVLLFSGVAALGPAGGMAATAADSVQVFGGCSPESGLHPGDLILCDFTLCNIGQTGITLAVTNRFPSFVEPAGVALPVMDIPHGMQANPAFSLSGLQCKVVSFSFKALESGIGALQWSFHPANGEAAKTVEIPLKVSPVPPRLDVADASVLEGDEGFTEAVFIVELDKPALEEVSAIWEAKGITAKNTTAEGVGDIGLSAGILQIPAGQSRAEIRVAVLGDREVEPDETFEVNLGTLTGALPGRLTARGTIRDNDGEAADLPRLAMEKIPGGGLRVRWTGGGAGWFLESSFDAANAGWLAVPGPVTIDAEGSSQAVATSAARQFFRLAHPP